jgi:PAS domain S-box-containing protein
MSTNSGILIVEDSFIVAYHLRTTLESEGYNVLGTQDSGEGALAFLEQQQPDLVLMDIMLSGSMDGIETARQIKIKYNLPIIYITALTDKNTIQRAKITEPYGYLTKPFEDREIFTVIEMALYKHDIESKLRQSEEKFFSTVRSISDAIIIIDQHYQITYLNPSAENMTGWTFTDAHRKNIFDVLKLRNADTDEFPVNPFQCSLSSGKKNAMLDDLMLVSRLQSIRRIGESSLSPLIDNKGNLVGLVIIFKDMTNQFAQEMMTKELEKERKTALIEGQEKERSRIAKDLHDGLGQMLNAIRMKINVVLSDSPHSVELSKLIDEAIQESVRISENLLPSKLKDFGLATCIKSLCNQIGNSSNLAISFESLGNPQDIDQLKKINLYRIAQEAINNAVKHAKAQTITVQLNEEIDRIQLTIEDDGQGINQSSHQQERKSSHNGLVNMRERAEIMGGKLIIESDDNRGTLVIVEAPLEHKNNDVEV